MCCSLHELVLSRDTAYFDLRRIVSRSVCLKTGFGWNVVRLQLIFVEVLESQEQERVDEHMRHDRSKVLHLLIDRENTIVFRGDRSYAAVLRLLVLVFTNCHKRSLQRGPDMIRGVPRYKLFHRFTTASMLYCCREEFISRNREFKRTN